LEYNVHVICESPITLAQADYLELLALAESKNLVLMESLKTAYTVAFQRMVVMLKSGLIGRIASVDAAVTSLAKLDGNSVGSLCDWGPQALLAIFKLLGTAYESKSIKTMFYKGDTVDDIGEEKSVKRYKIDSFTKIDFIYPEAVASLRVGKGVKSEGELIISGTKGYIFVPAPWWKTDYFEARFEDPRDNRKFFYQLKGEGIRNMIVQFVRSVSEKRDEGNVLPEITSAITKVIQDFYQGIDVIEICK
jgi:choline-phosphate cytidylyltransferase